MKTHTKREEITERFRGKFCNPNFIAFDGILQLTVGQRHAIEAFIQQAIDEAYQEGKTEGMNTAMDVLDTPST